MSDNRAIVTVILGVAFLVFLCLTIYNVETENTAREAIKAGLVQKRDPGNMPPIWTRP
jgi:hypothetical protein